MIKPEFSLPNYDFHIPKGLIAQEPLRPRDSSRLLLVERQKNSCFEKVFRDLLDFLCPGDVLVLNNTQVIKARLSGQRQGGGKLEVLLLKEVAKDTWEVLVKPGKRARINDWIIFGQTQRLKGQIIAKTDQGGRLIKFDSLDFRSSLEEVGGVPLPPYIKKEVSNPGDYQTVYAKQPGAVAAPTAGLHFTKQLLSKLKAKGVKIVDLTLHCSLATFRPVKTEDIRNHQIESEWVEISQETCEVVNSAKASGKRIFAVGTTAVRTLETAASLDNPGQAKVKPFRGETALYIVPGYKFKIIDAIITNFHTPCSSNLILIASFCGLDLVKKSYSYAQANNFRFFSFGDAMLIS